MFITLEADYAVRIVSVLCREKDKMDAKTISNDACVTLRFALKILRKLVAADIVKSYKGTQGGYIINKDPAQLTLKDVLDRKSTRLNSSHKHRSRMPSSA